MPRVTLLACLLGLFLSACGGGAGSDPSPSASPLVVTPGTWVIMGSSTAAGQGASPGQSWAARLEAAHNVEGVTLQNIAIGGLQTPQALPTATVPGAGRLPPEPTRNIDRALSFGPRLILLSFPTNDVVAGIPAAETAANLRLMRQLATSAGAATVVLGMQPRDGLSAGQRDAQAELDRGLAADAGDCFVSLYTDLADPSDATGRIDPAYAFGDGIHLNDAGHAVVLRRVEAVLASGRCVRTAP